MPLPLFLVKWLLHLRVLKRIGKHAYTCYDYIRLKLAHGLDLSKNSSEIMVKSDKSETTEQEIQVHVPEDRRVPAYVNVVNASVGVNEVILNFVSFSPTDTPQGTLVSRVAVPRASLAEIVETLKNAMEVADEVLPRK